LPWKQTKKDKRFEIAIISYPNLIEIDRKSIWEGMLVFFVFPFQIAVVGMVLILIQAKTFSK
jgi:hypothetical protein